jgi:RNA polymerase sigma factor (sigma-70 family)
LFSTWMYRVALNTALSFSRREFRRRRYVLAVEDRVLAAFPVQEPETDELRMLYEIIAALDPLNRALMLLYLDGNTYQEISDVLGISATNSATKINRLKETIKQQVAANARPGKENTI